jgi:predicted protein tyrosine phosphatase
MNVLFICNMGMQRSPTAAKLWKGDETDYAGIYRDDQNIENKIEWADLIIVMEEHQRKWIGENYPSEYIKKKILCLNIPDMYYYMSDELVRILKNKFKEVQR